MPKYAFLQQRFCQYWFANDAGKIRKMWKCGLFISNMNSTQFEVCAFLRVEIIWNKLYKVDFARKRHFLFPCNRNSRPDLHFV